jgi:hypothetical protein
VPPAEPDPTTGTWVALARARWAGRPPRAMAEARPGSRRRDPALRARETGSAARRPTETCGPARAATAELQAMRSARWAEESRGRAVGRGGGGGGGRDPPASASFWAGGAAASGMWAGEPPAGSPPHRIAARPRPGSPWSVPPTPRVHRAPPRRPPAPSAPPRPAVGHPSAAAGGRGPGEGGRTAWQTPAISPAPATRRPA